MLTEHATQAVKFGQKQGNCEHKLKKKVKENTDRKMLNRKNMNFDQTETFET